MRAMFDGPRKTAACRMLYAPELEQMDLGVLRFSWRHESGFLALSWAVAGDPLPRRPDLLEESVRCIML
ncbi:hypothetical protein B1806_02695 [Metallibacterium scheffleri]|uniref:Uncharacterized protein n=1 Tax=Metallibacterium scheffleri TaxID=993689 RepID=A0A4V3UTR4_9GAMM|nr:hypothetical protein B1806_02695 [Metallibacterium scheffleri]